MSNGWTKLAEEEQIRAWYDNHFKLKRLIVARDKLNAQIASLVGEK